MASPFHQYIIADEHVIPADHEIYYSEKVLHIPCTQPIDRKRTIAATPTRKEAGLPEDAFVFACFNGMQKTGESTFARWMTILKETPGSVLWLLGANEGVNQRLRTLAEKAGVAPERLIFAPKAANAHHLARIALADLFLDTFPYGAHSTAADALTMGLPVLTFAGKSFAPASATVSRLLPARPVSSARTLTTMWQRRSALREIARALLPCANT